MKTRESRTFSVVIPVYNDEEVLEELHSQLVESLQEWCRSYEVIYVDDGSRDRSFEVLQELRAKDRCIRLVKLARNFGQANAIAAGLDRAESDVVVIMDSDLQDRPSDVRRLVEAMDESGMPMAIAQWVRRKESLYRRFLSECFYWVSRHLTPLRYDRGLGVFRALSRDVVLQLRASRERTGTYLSFMLWTGLPHVAVRLERDPRFAGHSGYTLRKMLALSAERLFSYSLAPVRFAVLSGVFLAVVSVVLGVGLLARQVFWGHVVPGWTSIVVLVLFLFGMNFLILGVLGEYIGRVYVEARQRPRYVVELETNQVSEGNSDDRMMERP